MKINNFDDLMKYIIKYKNNTKKMSKIKENFKQYLELCNKQNIMLFINQVKKIPGIDTALYYNLDSICRKFGIEIILKMTEEMDFNERLLDSHINTDFYQTFEQRYQKEKQSPKTNQFIGTLEDIIER